MPLHIEGDSARRENAYTLFNEIYTVKVPF